MPRPPVDSLITHGRILTVDVTNRIVDDGAVAISGGRIIAVGGSGELESAFQPAQRIDCRGGIVHPGFIDAHIHVSQYTARSVLPRMASGTVNMGDWKAVLQPQDKRQAPCSRRSIICAAAIPGLSIPAPSSNRTQSPGSLAQPESVFG